MSRSLRVAAKLPRSVRRVIKRLPGVERLRASVAGTPTVHFHAPGAKRPVVYLPTWARWDEMRQRPQYLLAAFAAAGHPVYFVDPHESGERIVDGVTIVPTLGDVPCNDAILYVHFAPLVTMLDKFDDPVVVYDILDDLTIYEADEDGLPVERTVRHHHPVLVERADVVCVSNEVLAERHVVERPDLILVPNGVDVDRFAESPTRPSDVPTGGPVIGYHGAIAAWFAFDLLAAVAEMEPTWQFVLVGPVDPGVLDAAQKIAALDNVHMLGERPSNEMPSYVHAFDVGTVWFEVNHMTRGVSPLKVYEYLAASVPVVSSELPSCIAEPAVMTAATPQEFREAIASALDLAGDAAWHGLAASSAAAASWNHRLEPVLVSLDAASLRSV